MEKINICFTSPSKNAYSETFIQNLKQTIEGNIFYCFGGYFPTDSEDGKLKNHDSAPLILKGISKLGLLQKPIREIYFESYLKQKKIQVIIANYGPSGVEVSEVAKRLGIPLIVHFHGFDASLNTIINHFKDSYRKMFEIAKAIVVVSNEMEQTIIDLGADEKKVFLIRCAPANSFTSISPDYNSNQILVIGRFVEKKAPYLSLLAFKKAQEKIPDLRIKFIGEGELFQVCKDISLALKIKNIGFSGVMSAQSIAEEMANSFCFVQHSKTASTGDKEGTPVAILEAMASALPVISTYHAGIPDVITNDENGILVSEGDVQGMAEAIVKLYRDRNLAENLGKNARLYILEHLYQERYKADWDHLILKCLN